MYKTSFQQLYRLMKDKYPNYSSLWLKSLDEFGEEWEKEISLNICKVFGETFNHKWEEAVKGYAEFCTEALRAQVFFEKHGRYKASSYLECVEQCYHNADYMKVRYLPGQYLSHYIWPHHQRMLYHYINDLLPLIEKEVSLFYEVGVGCGLYSQKTLENIPNVKGVGVDISDYALEFTYEVVKLHGMADRYKIMNNNIIDSPLKEKVDFVISQEVLEHLETPEKFIAGLFEATRYGGWGYITAAINAAHTDHIYLYRSTEEVQQQIESVGWRVVDMQVEENYQNKPKEFRPTIVGFFVKKEKP